MVNGNWVYKTFVGGGISLTLAILGFMGNGIVRNNEINVAEHVKIRSEVKAADEYRDSQLDKVKDLVTDVRIEQTEQRVILQRIESKL